MLLTLKLMRASAHVQLSLCFTTICCFNLHQYAHASVSMPEQQCLNSSAYPQVALTLEYTNAWQVRKMMRLPPSGLEDSPSSSARAAWSHCEQPVDDSRLLTEELGLSYHSAHNSALYRHQVPVTKFADTNFEDALQSKQLVSSSTCSCSSRAIARRRLAGRSCSSLLSRRKMLSCACCNVCR